MGITYTEEYETRRAVSETAVGERNFVLEYIARSPIDGVANEVNATLYEVEGETKTRVGYGSLYGGASSVRFDSAASVAVDVQAALATRFYNDLTELIS